MSVVSIRVADDGELPRLQATLERYPEQAARARARALRSLSPWLERQVLQAATRASGLEPHTWQALARFQTWRREEALGVWLGTNAIPAHHLGDVTWSRRQPGAKAGGQLFPGTWSHLDAERTAGLIMRRRGEKRLPIDKVYWEVHANVSAAMDALMPTINARYQALLTRELERALEDAA